MDENMIELNIFQQGIIKFKRKYMNFLYKSPI